ncbi:MAG: DUF885 domain-containing protein [Candidatus Limnocylindrales bacterium]
MTDHRPTNLTGSPERVPAVGGTRTVPAPEPIVRDYLLLVLRLDQHRPGLVDAYYGPADLKAQADMESLRPPARLADDAIALTERLAAEIGDARRREFLRSQLVALEAQARVSAGESISYEELVTRFFDHAMSRVDDAIFQHAAAELDRSLPGAGPLNERLAAWEGRLTVEPERVQVVADHLAARFRARAAVLFGLPDREAARINLVRDRPWGGYNWYEGGRRSRVELNLDLPVRLPGLMHTVAHETYPGHHLEAATKEARLVDEAGWTELTILTINTPECLMHEGLADLGYRFAAPADNEVALLEEAIEIAGLPIAQDPVEMRAVTAIQPSIRAARAALRGVGGNAALMRHADGRSHDEVRSYLIEVGAKTAAGAAKQLEFIEDPLWRTYVPVYREGEALLERWLRLVPEPDRPARFARLLAEAHAPSGIEAELREAPARA